MLSYTFHICNSNELWTLLCFRQWLPRNKLEPLGVDSGLDRAKLVENKKPNVRKSVRKAYEKAIMHRCRVTGEPNPLSGESGTDEWNTRVLTVWYDCFLNWIMDGIYLN